MNNVKIHCCAAGKFMAEESVGAKPPVGTVAIEYAKALKDDMPLIFKQTMQAIVDKRYTIIKVPMIWDVFGMVFPDLSEDSVENSCIPPIFNKGRIAKAITIIPSPPTQWSMALHNKMPRGILSSPEITVAPIVVSPDMASKNASV